MNEIKPLIFLGRKSYYDFNYKNKWIKNRWVSFSLAENELRILMSYY
jgi:hypothetical protein